MDIQAIYLEMYKECCNQGRHHEAQRTSITTLSFAFAGAVVGYLAKGGGIRHEDSWVCLFLSVLGLVAVMVSYKQYERFRWAMNRAAQYRAAIDRHHTAPPAQADMLDALKEAGDRRHKKEHPVFLHVRLHTVWAVLFLLIATLGAWFTVIAFRERPNGGRSVESHPCAQNAQAWAPGRGV